MKSKFFYLIVLPAAASLLFFYTSCTQINVFEKNTPIPKYEWKTGFAASGTFNISDTNSYYNLSLVVRHTDAYVYNNIWLNVGLQSPGDSMYFQKIDFSLGDDAAGWEGAGMNDIWEVRKLLKAHTRFKKNGEYQFRILQIMRDDPLKNIMSVGLRVEKTL